MTLNELRDEVFDIAERHGFHENVNFGEKLMLIVSELSEAMEADRNDKWLIKERPCFVDYYKHSITQELGVTDYEEVVRGSVEEEIADAIMRLCDLAGIYKIDLEWHVKAKMAYNKARPYKHGKAY